MATIESGIELTIAAGPQDTAPASATAAANSLLSFITQNNNGPKILKKGQLFIKIHIFAQIVSIHTMPIKFFPFCLLLTFIASSCINNQLSTTEHDCNNVAECITTKSEKIYNFRNPYSIKCFEKALKNIHSSNTLTHIAPHLVDEIRQIENIRATHLLVEVYPKSLIELEQILYQKNTLLVTSYFNLKDNPALSSIDKVPFYTPGSNTDTLTFKIPAIQTIWRADEPIILSYEYHILDEIFIPADCTSLERPALTALENEAIAICSQQSTTTREINTFDRIGKLTANDSLLQLVLPMSHIEICVQLGTNVLWVTGSSDDGTFMIPANIHPAAHVYLTFKSSNWIISSENSVLPVCVDLGTLGDLLPSNEITEINISNTCNAQVLRVHRAIDYYYHGDHQIYPATGSSPITVRCMSASSNETLSAVGLFHYTPYSNSHPYIDIYNHSNSDNTLMATVCHELGHYSMYEKMGNINFYRTHRLLQESYASFVGWHIIEHYYSSLGYSHGLFATIAGDQWRQDWLPSDHTTMLQYYSPLFVDLVDELDQSILGYNNDPIVGLPISLIENELSTIQSWGQLRAALRSYVGSYYTSDQFIGFIAPYQQWFNNENNENN